MFTRIALLHSAINRRGAKVNYTNIASPPPEVLAKGLARLESEWPVSRAEITFKQLKPVFFANDGQYAESDAPYLGFEDALEFFERIEAIFVDGSNPSHKVVELPLSKILPTQNNVIRKTVHAYLTGKAQFKAPPAIEYKGKYYLNDGHNCLASLAMCGLTSAHVTLFKAPTLL